MSSPDASKMRTKINHIKWFHFLFLKMETVGVEPTSKMDKNKSLRVYLLIFSISSGKQLKPEKLILGFI